MKIILSKDDIEALVKKYYGMDAVAWQDDGTIVLDTTLEKIINDTPQIPINVLRSPDAVYNQILSPPRRGIFPLFK